MDYSNEFLDYTDSWKSLQEIQEPIHLHRFKRILTFNWYFEKSENIVKGIREGYKLQ